MWYDLILIALAFLIPGTSQIILGKLIPGLIFLIIFILMIIVDYLTHDYQGKHENLITVRVIVYIGFCLISALYTYFLLV
jgi:TM2 domain-containing membrane protein YozV